MARLARRERGVAHLAEVLVACREARAAEMCTSEVSAPDRVARKSAAMAVMSAKVMPAAAAKAVPMSAAMAVTAAATTSAMAAAAALGDCVARQHHHENKSRNSQRAPNHGTLPAVSPLMLRRK
jgi:hypothetical protein